MPNQPIVVVGSLNADLVVYTNHFPSPGETVRGSDLTVVPGGKSANQAVAAARLGGTVTMVGAVGDDAHGLLLIDSLKAAGVDTSHVGRRDDAATGTAVITVDDRGENTIIISAGANGTLDSASINHAGTAIDQAAVLCLCLEVPVDVVLAAARAAQASNTLVLLNLSPFGDVPEELLDLTDILLLNEHEARDLAGAHQSDSSWETVASALRQRKIHRAVITAGAAGSIVIDAGTIASISALKVDAVDTTGCGDAFMGSLALRLASEDDLLSAVRYASTVGSCVATGRGAQASYPDQGQLAAFIAAAGL